MNLHEAREKLEKYGQEHVLSFFDELSDEGKQELILQIDKTDFSIISSKEKEASRPSGRGEFSGLSAMEISEIAKNEDEYRKIGIEAIKSGKVAAVLLAGGMGTRLGSDDPKGMYNIGITKDVYIFQRLIENAMKVVDEAGRFFPFYIMTSDKNHDKTVAFFEKMDYFGYDKSYIRFFKQEMAPASDYEGKVYMEEKGRMATSPNGNGGWYLSMAGVGLAKEAMDAGVKYLNVFAVDNVLQRILDPVFVGATINKDVACGAMVVRKAEPHEKVGNICLEDGRPSIIEYYDLTDEMANEKDENGNPVYNFGVILNYLFRIEDLQGIIDRNLPLHVVEKKIPHIDRTGTLIKPEEPNGYKYEALVIDMIHELSSCLPYEVERERTFAPIKNKTGVDSVESARELCKLNGIEL